MIRITTSDLLLVLLFATVVSDYRKGMSGGEHIYAFVFGVIGIFLYFHIGGVFRYLTALFCMCIISTIVFSRKYSLKESIERASQFTGLTVLLALTGGLLRSWQWVPDLVLVGVGVYMIYRYVFRSATEGGSLTGAGGFLFSSAIQIGQTPKGIVTGGILYVGLFSGVDTVAQLLPFLVSVYLGSAVAESFRSIVLNGSGIFWMLILAVTMFHWFPLLQRLPYSVRHWESGTYDYDREKLAPNRPLVRGLSLPILSMGIVHVPQWSIETNGVFGMQKWRHSILVGYLLVLSVLTLYSIAAIPNFHRIRRFVPGSSWFVSDRPELDGDFRTYLAAGFLVIVLNVVMTDFSVVPILLGFVVFYVCGVYFSRVSMGWNLILTSVVFAFLIPMYMTPTETARTFWQILVFFLFVYALSIVRVHVANQ